MLSEDEADNYKFDVFRKWYASSYSCIESVNRPVIKLILRQCHGSRAGLKFTMKPGIILNSWSHFCVLCFQACVTMSFQKRKYSLV